jgi:REP element-mobilizing transposase RayT
VRLCRTLTFAPAKEIRRARPKEWVREDAHPPGLESAQEMGSRGRSPSRLEKNKRSTGRCGLARFLAMEVHDSVGGFVGRRHPASGVHIYSGQPTIVFLTLVTRHRERWLDQPLIHLVLRETWMKAQAWLVGYYLLMPDHLHLFCAPHDLSFGFDEWTTFWKRRFKRSLGIELQRCGAPVLEGGNEVPTARTVSKHSDSRVQSESITQPIMRAVSLPPGVDAWGVRYLSDTDREFRQRWVQATAPTTGTEPASKKTPQDWMIDDPAWYRWQEGRPWHTRLRRSEHYQDKWQYVRENPLRQGYVTDPADWPFQGMLNVLRW